MQKNLLIQGQRWYFTQDDLIESLRKIGQQPKLFVCMIRESNGKDYHLFSNFEDPYLLQEYMQKFRLPQRCFHEVPLPNQLQKIRFDIDMENSRQSDADLLVGTLIFACYSVLFHLNCKVDVARDFFLFTSHKLNPDKDGVHPKLSFHLIIDNWACNSTSAYNKVYWQIFSLCQQLLGERSNLLDYLDSSLVDPKHPLRIFGSSKLRENRIKKWEKNFTVHTLEGSFSISTIIKAESSPRISVLKSSLITWADYCTVIVLPSEPEKESSYEDYNLSEDIIFQVENWLKAVNSENTFSVKAPRGNTIPLIRQRRSFCPICQRNHDSENAYLIILSSKSMPKVYFRCHRNPKESITVCENANNWINPEDAEEIDLPEVTRSHHLEIEERLEELMK